MNIEMKNAKDLIFLKKEAKDNIVHEQIPFIIVWIFSNLRVSTS